MPRVHFQRVNTSQSSDYRAALAEYIRAQARPLDKFSHQPRLYHLTRELGAGLEYDDEIVYAAAWLHDLGVFVGHRPEDPVALAQWDCVGYAMREAPGVLERLGFPTHKIPAVVEVIRTHQPAANPATLEGGLVRDADILEQLGAIAILRTVSKVGRDTRFATFSDALAALQKSADTLFAQLRLPSAQELAQPRLRLLQGFLAAAQAEAEGQPL